MTFFIHQGVFRFTSYKFPLCNVTSQIFCEPEGVLGHESTANMFKNSFHVQILASIWAQRVYLSYWLLCVWRWMEDDQGLPVLSSVLHPYRGHLDGSTFIFVLYIIINCIFLSRSASLFLTLSFISFTRDINKMDTLNSFMFLIKIYVRCNI